MSDLIIRPTTVVSVRGKCPADFADDPDFVYVGRAMPRQGWKGSVWGNPFIKGMSRYDCFAILRQAGMFLVHLEDASRPATTRECVRWYRGLLEYRKDLKAKVGELRGKKLGCWCCEYGPGVEPVKPCHAVVLARLADGIEQDYLL